MDKYSVVIPTLDEGKLLPDCIASIQKINPKVEIILADGGSQDNTLEIAREKGIRITQSRRGRGIQCNAGAALASGNILLFLHADSRLPDNSFDLIGDFFRNDRVQIGTFRLVFDQYHWLLNLYAVFSRFDSVFTRFGDQCITIRKAFFDELGHFPEWPLFEDVGLLRAARRQSHIYSFPARVTTSARRYIEYGIVRQQIWNLWYMLQFLSGVSPQSLASQYEHVKDKKRKPA
jgi:rSAM/selenodomain-associated transferase 2